MQEHQNATARTVFVTGATGLLGSNLVNELLARGDRVRGLVRDPARATKLLPQHPDLELVKGDMAEPEQFATALEGVDVLFHTAAYFRDSTKGGKHWPQLEKINVTGTRRLIAAAYAAGIRRMLHVSSIGTLSPRARNGVPVDETRRLRANGTWNDYYRSKILADAEVEAAMQRWPDFRAVFVLPGFMQGPGDAGPTAAGQTVLDFLGGRLPGMIDAHFSYVDARDVAFTCAQAEAHAKRGAYFIAAGRRTHLREAIASLERVTGRKGPARTVPTALLALVALANETWARLSGRPVLLGWTNFRSIRTEGRYANFDSSRAVKELDVTFRPLDETMRDAVTWFKDHGFPEAADLK